MTTKIFAKSLVNILMLSCCSKYHVIITFDRCCKQTNTCSKPEMAALCKGGKYAKS